MALGNEILPDRSSLVSGRLSRASQHQCDISTGTVMLCRIERDAKAGRLDKLAEQAVADFRAGRARDL